MPRSTQRGRLLACASVRVCPLKRSGTIRGRWPSSKHQTLPRVVDHVGFAVADYQRSKAFYERALAPLGMTLLMEFAGESAGFGRSERPSFFIEAHGTPVRGRFHIALRAESRAQVDAFHAAAIEAGGTDNGAPGGSRHLPPRLLRRHLRDGHAFLTYLIGWGYDGWDGTKVLWTVPRYNGPYIVRGRQLDGTGELRFDQGPTWTNKLHEELRLVGPYGLLNPAATFCAHRAVTPTRSMVADSAI